MMKCCGCLKNTKEASCIKCSSSACEKSFCLLCLNISAMPADKKKTWKCPDCCATQKKGGDNSSTPVRTLEENITMRKKTDINMDGGLSTDVKELVEEVRCLTREISLLKQRLEDATSSLSSCQSKLEELTHSVASNDARIKHLENRDREVKVLEVQVSELQQELNTQAQHHLRNELELAGIPENNNESLHHIALLAARKVGVGLEDGDIDWVARVGPRVKSAVVTNDGAKFPRPIVVRLLRRNKRDEILKAAKSRKDVTTSDFGLNVSGISQRIYYNERLTKENRLLFRAVRAKSKEHGYTFCWVTQGNIFIKQREGKPALPVRTHGDLLRIFAAPSEN